MAQPTTNVFEPREDMGLRIDEFDLAMNRQGFIGHRLMPIITRTKQSGKYPRVKRGQLLQNLDTTRNPDGTYPRSKREFSDDNYDTREHGLEAVLDDRTLAKYDDIIDAEEFEGEVIENSLLLSYEREVAALLFNPTTFSGHTAAVSVEWSTWASALPATDIKTARQTIRLAFGMKPNALIVSDPVFENLINCAQVVDRLKYQGFQDARPGELSRQALAISLNIDEVIVADALYNSAMPGVDASLADIWDDEYALLARVAKGPNPLENCLGRTFMWDREGAQDGDRMGIIAEQYYENNRRGGVIRRRTDWGLEIIDITAGYLLSNITA